jgi:acyl-CoA thioesterase I
MQVRVLAVGNWVSAGMGNQHRFTDELEEILERSIKGLDLVFTHRGVSGERTATTAQRLMQEIALVDPDLVLWQVGTNDALMRVPVAEFEAVLSGAVDWIKSHKKDVVLVGLQYSAALSKNAHYRDIKDAVSRVAARHNVLVVRRYEAVQFIATASREQARLAKDEFLMTELGYKCMAEHIARALVVNVFARRNPDGKAGQVAVAPRVAQPAPAVSLPNDSRNDK